MKMLEQFQMNAQKLRSGWPGVGAWWVGEAPAQVEEQPFTPFDLSPLRAQAAADHTTAIAPEDHRPPATLAELGVPAELAHNFEVVLRAMGSTEGGQVIGFRFRSPDGASHALRLADAA